jgi:hypothetical protein
MGTFQAIRAYYEVPIIAAYQALSPAIPVFVDNQEYSDCDALTEFVLLRVNFGTICQQGITQNLEYVQGNVILEVYSAKGVGPGRGQELIEVGVYTLYDIGATTGGRVGNVKGNFGVMVGPNFTALDGRPHYLTRLSIPIQARYYRN